MSTYIAVTPARDEERLLPGLISSVVQQSRRPSKWILIDDGSADRTPQQMDRAARSHDWIEVCHLARNRPRAAGGESVIMQFLTPEVWGQYDFIMRLDADLTFDSDLAELLLREFNGDHLLGIAGATLFELSADRWIESRQPDFHTRGAMKMYRKSCFEAIGGLDAEPGWDTLDEALAMMMGFKTRCFRHIQARHHRPQGAVEGIWKSRLGAGRAAYRIGYSPLFMLVRSLRRMLMAPPVIGGAALIAGYCDAYLRSMPKAAPPELEKFVRRQQVRRLFGLQSQWR